MAARKDIGADVARQLLDYDRETGILRWRPRTPEMFILKKRTAEAACATWNGRFAGKIAGSIRPDGYCRVRINDVLYYGHRIAWLIVHGEWPPAEIDHAFGISCGDSLDNLRTATRSQNMQNAAKRKDNKSGYTGVSWSKQAHKWGARINAKGKYLHLGFFDDPLEAAEAYLAAKRKYHLFQPVPRDA